MSLQTSQKVQDAFAALALAARDDIPGMAGVVVNPALTDGDFDRPAWIFSAAKFTPLAAAVNVEEGELEMYLCTDLDAETAAVHSARVEAVYAWLFDLSPAAEGDPVAQARLLPLLNRGALPDLRAVQDLTVSGYHLIDAPEDAATERGYVTQFRLHVTASWGDPAVSG